MRQRDILTVTSTIGTLALAISQDQDETNLFIYYILQYYIFQEQDETLSSSLEEEAEQDHRDLGERKKNPALTLEL